MGALVEQAYAAALAALPHMGPIRLAQLMRLQQPSALWEAIVNGKLRQVILDDFEYEPTGESRNHRNWSKRSKEWSSAARCADLHSMWDYYGRSEVAVNFLAGHGYPSALEDDHQAPGVLFSSGNVDLLKTRRVGIIGTRHCTGYGRAVATQLGRELAGEGVSIVSGLALGIDGAAHEGAMSDGLSRAIAVVGSGIDVVYPKANKKLWQQIKERGLIVSEAPLGALPDAWRFPARNRIIAALSEVLVVVESHIRGGSQYTIDAANDRGIRVMAVPGPIYSPTSAGTNRLISEGCAPVCSVDDVLVALDLHATSSASPQTDRRLPPDSGDASILQAVDWTSTSIDELLERTDQSLGAVAASLSRLEMLGWVENQQSGWARIK